jgi:hypothetical protein
MRIGLTESVRARGTEQADGMLGGQLFGPGGARPLPNIGSTAANTRAAPKAPERPVRCPSIPFVALRPERRARSAPASRNMTDDDHNLDDLKDQLSRGFGVQVREDLQVRAEIVIQPEEGRWVFTPDELSDLAEGLRSVLLKSKPEGGWPFRLTLKQYVGLFDHAIPDGHSYSE